MAPTVIAVARDEGHNFSKPIRSSITLEKDLGVVGDAHHGATARHRTIVAKDPGRPNRRQVHLLQSELFQELSAEGFDVRPGDLGENILTRGIDLLALPEGALLHIGERAIVEVTGLRNPCRQIDRFQAGLKAAVLVRTENGELLRKAGIMAVVVEGGPVKSGDGIEVEMPQCEFRPLPVL